MQKSVFILVFFWIASTAYPQRGDDHGKICSQPNVVFVKKDYKRFKKDSCNLKKYPDSQKTKELVCEAAYYTRLNDYGTSVELLKHAYARASSEKLKFRILNMTSENYSLLGDTARAATYRDKAIRMLAKNPDIDK